jgi:16S rRNA (adenine1518-N6/adenine1519-N6)-dimethyltransferase
MRPGKKFGQHFLEPPWADKLVGAIDPRPTDRFLEIGSGPGALTLRLAPRVAHLTAIEVDREMVGALADRLPPNVQLVHADFLAFDLDQILRSGPIRIAGNLPYNISSPILFRLVDASRQYATLTDATVMIQREVAERIEASPGSRDYGVLSILIQLRADVRRVLTLPPGAFRPSPAIHSAVVRLSFRPPLVRLRDEADFEAMVRSMFTQRRKTLGNSLAPFAGSRRRDAREALEAAGIEPRRRAETLQLTELARLADYFSNADA